MKKFNLIHVLLYRILFLFISFTCTPLFARTWDCQIFPSEQKIEIDPISDAKIIFITTHPANDYNLYFHDRCWLLNDRLMLFISDRTGRSEIFGYLVETGELIRLNRPEDIPAGNPFASRSGDKFYVVRENTIFQWNIDLKLNHGTHAKITEIKLCDFPVGSTPISGLHENSDGTLISFAYKIGELYYISIFNKESKKIQVVAALDFPIQHVQFSWTRPDLLSFARSYGSDTAPLDPNEPAHARIWFVNTNIKMPVPAFYQKPGELVTHECWWLNDQITFIGGHRKEEGHVKVLDLKTGEIRIIGAGAWWENGEPAELAKENWWHQSGSPDGTWVAGDNWHGIIAIFNARTTEKKILSSGHRIYGSGAHLHVGWDLFGKRVQFTSNKLGNPDVCVAIIPEKW